MRFRVAARPQPELPRTADLVLRKSRVAVFVDGCYWHGCPEHHTQPATNAEYWADKIAGNDHLRQGRSRPPTIWRGPAGPS